MEIDVVKFRYVAMADSFANQTEYTCEILEVMQ